MLTESLNLLSIWSAHSSFCRFHHTGISAPFFQVKFCLPTDCFISATHSNPKNQCWGFVLHSTKKSYKRKFLNVLFFWANWSIQLYNHYWVVFFVFFSTMAIFALWANKNNFHNITKCNGNDTLSTGIFISRISRPYLDNNLIIMNKG